MEQKLKKLLHPVVLWQSIVWWLCGFVVAGGLLVYKLDSLVKGLSLEEQAVIASAKNTKTILDNPIHAPYKFLVFGITRVLHQPWAPRLASTALALLTIYLFYLLLRSWFSTRLAVLGSVLLLCSAWFLHIARLAVPDMVFPLVTISLLAFGTWVRQTKSHGTLILGLGAVLMVLTLYLPGGLWFVIPLLMWQRRTILKVLSTAPKIAIVLAGLLVLGGLTPLALGWFKNPDLIRPILGLPTGSFGSLRHAGTQILKVPYRLFLKGPLDPARWLGTVPMVEFFSGAMALLGVFVFMQKYRLERSWFLIGLGLITLGQIGLGNGAALASLLPVIYVLATAGIGYMLREWLRIFPRNPIARSAGIGLLSLLVALSCFYTISHYFIAWPKAPATVQAFHQVNE